MNNCAQNLDNTGLGGAKNSMQNRCAYLAFKSVTVSLAILMIVAAIEALATSAHVSEAVQIVFVATYQIFFGLLILSFEMVTLNSDFDFLLQRNVGFLYTILGRPLFIIFVAFISFGLKTTLGLVAGIALLCFGLLQIVLFLKYPDILEAINYERAHTAICKNNTSNEIISARL